MTSEFLEVLWVHGDMVLLFLWCLEDAALLIPEKPHYTILKCVTPCVLHVCVDMSTCLLSYLCLAAPFSGLYIFTLLEVLICLVFLPVIKLSLTSKVMSVLLSTLLYIWKDTGQETDIIYFSLCPHMSWQKEFCFDESKNFFKLCEPTPNDINSPNPSIM